MSKLDDLIETAKREVGICEIPMGSNDVKYNREYWGERSSYADLPWCVVFCWWCCKHAPEQIPFPSTAHCNGVEAYAKSNGQWVTGDYQPGDFVIFDYDGDGSRDHIGLVIEANGDTLTTVEGNYGDKVSLVNRKASELVGAYRPDYGDEVVPTPVPTPMPEPSEENGAIAHGGTPSVFCQYGDIGPAVQAVQVLLHYRFKQPLRNSIMTNGDGDGEFGSETEKACIEVLGKPFVDGEGWGKLIGGVG